MGYKRAVRRSLKNLEHGPQRDTRKNARVAIENVKDAHEGNQEIVYELGCLLFGDDFKRRAKRGKRRGQDRIL